MPRKYKRRTSRTTKTSPSPTANPHTSRPVSINPNPTPAKMKCYKYNSKSPAAHCPESPPEELIRSNGLIIGTIFLIATPEQALSYYFPECESCRCDKKKNKKKGRKNE